MKEKGWKREKFIALICISFLMHRAYKTIEDEDLKFPLIYGEGKKVSVCVCVCQCKFY